MAHTPGPWKVVWEYCDCGGDYQCSHGKYPYELIAPNEQVERYPNAKPGKTFPAVIANFSEANNVTIADIQLMEAAPALLEACEAAEPLLDLARARLAASAQDEVGYCHACSSDELCYNHQQQENLMRVLAEIRAAIAAARPEEGEG